MKRTRIRFYQLPQQYLLANTAISISCRSYICWLTQLYLSANSSTSFHQLNYFISPIQLLHFANSTVSFRLYAFTMYGSNRAS